MSSPKFDAENAPRALSHDRSVHDGRTRRWRAFVLEHPAEWRPKIEWRCRWPRAIEPGLPWSDNGIYGTLWHRVFVARRADGHAPLYPPAVSVSPVIH